MTIVAVAPARRPSHANACCTSSIALTSAHCADGTISCSASAERPHLHAKSLQCHQRVVAAQLFMCGADPAPLHRWQILSLSHSKRPPHAPQMQQTRATHAGQQGRLRGGSACAKEHQLLSRVAGSGSSAPAGSPATAERPPHHAPAAARRAAGAHAAPACTQERQASEARAGLACTSTPAPPTLSRQAAAPWHPRTAASMGSCLQ